MRGSGQRRAGPGGGPGTSRRRFLVGAGLLGVTAAVPAGYLAWPRSSASTGQGLLLPSAPFHPRPHSFQIVAHQDDDLLFLNPDLSLVREGLPTTTVYLTAGEANGTVDNTRSRTQFAADRQAGARAAYAALAGVPNDWKREVYTSATGQHAELATLNGAEHVRLYFLSLPDAGDTAYGDNGQALPGLLLGRFAAIPTLVPDGGPVTAASRFTRDALVGTLAELLAQAEPSVVRTLDPQYAEQGWRGARQHGGDNVDHSASARFADLAVRQHLNRKPSVPVAVVNYVGYGVASTPGNVTPTALAAKTSVFSAYARSDGNVRTFRKNYDAYLPSQRYRWAAPTPVLIPSGSGLAAFAVLGRQVMWWRRDGPLWQGPLPLGPDDAGDVVAVCGTQDHEGRIRLFALSIDVDGGGSQIVTALQNKAGGDAFGPWQGLAGPLLAPVTPEATGSAGTAGTAGTASSTGNPGSPGAPGSSGASNTPSAPRQLDRTVPGAPVAVTTAAGDVMVIAAAVDGTLYSRTLKAGTQAWPPWTELVTADLVGLPSVTAAKNGAVDLYAAAMVPPDGPNGTADAVCRLRRWVLGPQAAKPLPDLVFPDAGVLGPPTAVRGADGGVSAVGLTRDGKAVVLRSQFTGAWAQSTDLPAADLSAAPTAHLVAPAAGGGLLLAGRNTDASITVLEEQPGQGFAKAWTGIGGKALGAPAVISDGSGRTDVIVIDTGGRLSYATRLGPGQPFQDWRQAGL